MNNIILIGNPNVGKTTLFNSLTKSNEKASNWHGVTVDCISKKYSYKDECFNVTDLPGLYSLNGYSNEEKLAIRYLNNHKDNLIINICDANNLKRNLKLTCELIKNSFKVLLVINMVNDFKFIDSEKLSKIFNIDVVKIDARKSNLVELKNAIYNFFCYKNCKNNSINTNFNIKTENINSFIEELNKNKKKDITEKLDLLFFNKILFIPLFIVTIYLVFFLTFGKFGEIIKNYFEHLVKYIFKFLESFIISLNMSDVIKYFLISGVLSSVFAVLSFLPQITLLLILFGIIEDMGIMSRFAFMLDGIMKKIGLTGKSLFSIMMGFGCTTTAVLTTRNLENYNLRKRTALILPFSTCSAKLPILLIISSIFFDKYKYFYVLGLYLFSIFIAVIFASISAKIYGKIDNVFILEMPRYRFPYIKKILKDAIHISVEFLIKVGTTILGFSILFWLLQNFSIKFEYLAGNNYKSSILYLISNKISFVFKQIGLGNAGIISVLLFGLVAKELIVVGLLFVNGVTDFNTLSVVLKNSSSLCFFDEKTAIIFLLFILLYSPCVSALATIKNEFGRKTATNVFILQILISYAVCFLVYRILNNIILLYLIIFLFSIAILIRFMLKYNWKIRCGGNCYACRKF